MNINFNYEDILYGLKQTYRYTVAILFLKHLIFIKDLKKIKKITWLPDKYILFGMITLLLLTSLIDYMSSILLMTIILIQYNFNTFV